jgi:hypothetical protein
MRGYWQDFFGFLPMGGLSASALMDCAGCTKNELLVAKGLARVVVSGPARRAHLATVIVEYGEN